jgi:hypothetical protein
LQAQQSQDYWIAVIDCNSSRWIYLLLYLKPCLSLYIKFLLSDVCQAYIMYLEVGVAKVNEDNMELKKKQVYLKFLY